MGLSVCVYSEYRLRVRPRGDRFTKPLGSSIVLTCEVESTTGHGVRVTTLRWLDERRYPISESPGRSVKSTGKANVDHVPPERRRGAQLPLIAVEPVKVKGKGTVSR